MEDDADFARVGGGCCWEDSTSARDLDVCSAGQQTGDQAQRHLGSLAMVSSRLPNEDWERR